MAGPFSELQPGSELGGYTIIRTLGRGGMATVYLAQHPRLPRQYALKVLNPSLGHDPKFQMRFEREAHLAAQLDHPNVVAVHDRGIDSGLMWLAMQFVDGTDAAAILENRTHGLDPARALSIISQAAAGLDAAHRQGMLHRDVKPANLLVTAEGRVLVTDFGIARALDDATNLTDTGMMVATIAYAAPEVISGEDADHRSDIYALGCTLYELLTGSKVFPRASRVAVMDAHLQSTPRPPSELRPGLSPALDAVLAKALSKQPQNRHQSCRELADAAVAAVDNTNSRTLLDVPVQRNPAPIRPHPRSAAKRPRTRRRFVIAAVVATTMASLGVGAWALLPDDKPTLAGRWIGSVVGDQTGRLVADISDDGHTSAKVSYPDTDTQCAGVWKETAPSANGIHTLTESITQGNCPDASITLRRDSDGTVRVTSRYFSASQNRNIDVAATLSHDVDLGLDVPITVPACDGTGVVMLGASVTPGQYAEQVASFLSDHPGASYLRTDSSCPSLRQATPDGDPIYAVFQVAGKSTAEVCDAVAAAGGDAYGTWLDRTSNPSTVISC